MDTKTTYCEYCEFHFSASFQKTRGKHIGTKNVRKHSTHVEPCPVRILQGLLDEASIKKLPRHSPGWNELRAEIHLLIGEYAKSQ